MINYDKLKLANELVNKIPGHIFSAKLYSHNSEVDSFFHLFNRTGYEEFFNSIDDLIQKLQELTEPKSKYKVGDEIWCVHDNKIASWRLPENGAFFSGTYIYAGYFEKDLYPTKQQLIEAQIAYWQAQQEPISQTLKARKYMSTMHCSHKQPEYCAKCEEYKTDPFLQTR